MRMFEKYSTPTAYLWSIMTTFLGFFTLEQCVSLIGIVCTVITCAVNWYYRRKEFRLKSREKRQKIATYEHEKFKRALAFAQRRYAKVIKALEKL